MIDSIRSAVTASLPIQEVSSLLSDRKNIHLDDFIGSSQVFLLQKLLTQLPYLLVVARDHEKAVAIASDFEQLGTDDVHVFPPTGRKPYDDQKIIDSSLLVLRSEVL